MIKNIIKDRTSSSSGSYKFFLDNYDDFKPIKKKYGEVKCLEDKYLSKKLKEFLKDKTSDEKLFYTKRAMQKKAQELGFTCHDLRRAYSKLVKRNLLNELVEINEDEKEKIIEEEVKTALRHSRFETSKKYLYSKRIKV